MKPQDFLISSVSFCFLVWMPARIHAESPPSGGVKKLTAAPLKLRSEHGRIGMDYLAYDPSTSTVWAPGGNTGLVYVIDQESLKITPIDDFPTLTQGDRIIGPTAASAGSGYVYVGNRGNRQVCAVHGRSFKIAGCVAFDSAPDGVAYVAFAKEVWVTLPKDRSMAVLDVSSPAAPKLKQMILVEGQPEGYAVDNSQGRFYTNLEDKNVTLAFDLKTHREIARYQPGCGKDGPRGLSFDEARKILIVACTDKLVTLLLKENGRKGGELETGGGVDNPDYHSASHTVYAASGKTSTLTIAEVRADGTLVLKSTAQTALGARVVVVDREGNAFVADPAEGKLWVVRPDR